MNFYLKSSEEIRRGFEFTHKSFGDYLAARAIFDAALTVTETGATRMDVAQSDWFASVSTGTLSDEILAFLRDEIRLRLAEGLSLDKVSAVKTTFEQLALIAASDGFSSVATPSVGTWDKLSTQHRNAETMVWAVMNACARVMPSDLADEKKLVNLAIREHGWLRMVILRLGQDREYAPFYRCLSHLNAPNSDLYSMTLTSADFSSSNLANSIFSCSMLFSASFEKADVSNSFFVRSSVDHARFAGANVSGVRFLDAFVGGLVGLRDSQGVFVINSQSIFNGGIDGDTLRKSMAELAPRMRSPTHTMERGAVSTSLVEELFSAVQPEEEAPEEGVEETE
jgi:hypothetical protein